MKIGVMTGIEALDMELQNKVKQVTIAYYPEFFFKDSEITMAVVSPINKNIDFENFLYELRKRNIRVIVLLDNENSKYMPFVLSLGITDIIFDPIAIEKILNKLQYNTPFSDVAKYYTRLGTTNISKAKKEQTYDNSNEQLLKAQMINLFKYFGKEANAKLSINELMALLENELIKKNI